MEPKIRAAIEKYKTASRIEAVKLCRPVFDRIRQLEPDPDKAADLINALFLGAVCESISFVIADVSGGDEDTAASMLKTIVQAFSLSVRVLESNQIPQPEDMN